MIKKKSITILAVDTSCDDTGIAIIKASKNGSFKVLSNIISSQVKIHEKYGGVYPMLAKREHQRNLVPVLKRAMGEAKILEAKSLPCRQAGVKRKAKSYSLKFKSLEKILEREDILYKQLEVFLKKYEKPDIDLIAVTNGPGLEPCLWVGVNFARTLSLYWDIPVVPVNHIEAHMLVNFLPKIDENSKRKAKSSKLQLKTKNSNFPAVCLVVSGGHTQLILMKKIGKYEILGETRDDAAGECFDKTARILGLGYPGGPAIAEFTRQWKSEIRNPKSEIKLPRPMINTKDYDFSFSGLKTAVLYEFKKQNKGTQKDKQYIQGMAAEIQQSIIDVLIKKTINAAINYKAKTIILGGGVVANKELRRQFAEKIQHLIPNTQYLTPNTQLCTDNALMVAITAYFRHRNPSTGSGYGWKNIEVDANLRLE